MTDLALTPQRRAELVALLGAEPRLRTRFPRVADYLDTASRLPDTGDERPATPAVAALEGRAGIGPRCFESSPS